MARHDPISRILQLALVMVALVALPASAQVLKKPAQARGVTVPGVGTRARVFHQFGKISTIQGTSATAEGQATVGEHVVNAIDFDLPAEALAHTKPGQPVWLSADGQLARFVLFPINVPDIKKRVGRGPGKGSFWVQTKNVRLSNTGIINGEVKVLSEDALAGFTGAVAVKVSDADTNDLTEWLQAGCWGVNQRSGREETWSVKMPEDAALKARTVTLKLFNSPCGRDRWNAAMKKAELAAEVAGKFVEVYAKVKGASGGT